MTIEMSGGLGNQMFQYALYLKMKNMGRRVRLDISRYLENNPFRKFELDVFGVEMDDIPTCGGESLFFKMKNRLKQGNLIYDEGMGDLVGTFQPQIFDIVEGSRLRGYWQNENYFKDIENRIREIYTFREDLISARNVELAHKMKNTKSVSVHIRRGDYLQENNQKVYGMICDNDYYNRAINYMRNRFEDLDFYFFSDETEWIKDNIIDKDGRIVDWNIRENSWQDMFLMSNCRYHIIANSTFSWWGAWLGTHEDKLVISPNKWFANHCSTDTICKGWIRI